MLSANRYKIVFMGTPEFAVPSLRALLSDARFEVVTVVTRPDKPVGRKQVITPSPVKMLAQEKGIVILQPDKVKNNPTFWEQLRSFNPDVIVVVAYGKILPQEVLDIPPKGILNVHASDLPKYRGASPIQAAILNGDATTRVRVQKMVLAMDEGPLFDEPGAPVEILPSDTYQSLSQKLADSASMILLRVLWDYLANGDVPQPQSEQGVSYAKPIRKEEGQINWQDDEESIARQVRAYFPWPSAYTTLGGVPVKILSAEVAEADNPKGTIQKLGPDMFIGHLRISQLQPAGGKPMSGSAFLAGHPEIIGISVL